MSKELIINFTDNNGNEKSLKITRPIDTPNIFLLRRFCNAALAINNSNTNALSIISADFKKAYIKETGETVL